MVRGLDKVVEVVQMKKCDKVVRIALCGLNVQNLGDVVIFDTVRFLLSRTLAEIGVAGSEIVEVDMLRSEPKFAQRKVKCNRVKKRKSFSEWVSACVKRVPYFRFLLMPTACFVLRMKWRRTKEYRRFMKEELNKISDLNLLLFVGGGLIKYHRQCFHYLIDEITSIAERDAIPVVFNAVGVEGFDRSNPECEILKRALGRRSVLKITTRDDVGLLKDGYECKTPFPVESVCDPAFWVPETYGVSWTGEESGCIGLNVIRPAIFGEYGTPIDPDELAGLYRDVMRIILESGRRVELFSNGVPADARFVKRILSGFPLLFYGDRISVKVPASARELVETIAGYERYLAVRLHASIIGTSLGIPNVSIVWNRKQRFFGEYVGLAENYIERDGLSAENIYAKLMSARPYVVDPAYKNSVFESIKKTLKDVLL